MYNDDEELFENGSLDGHGCDIEREKKRLTCQSVAINEGLIPSRGQDVPEFNFINRMIDFMYEDKNNSVIVHSWDEDFRFRDVSAKTIYEHVVGRMRLNGFRLVEDAGFKHVNVHVWGDDDTAAFALCMKAEDFERVIMAVSYTSSSDNHFDLVEDTIRRYINFEKVLKDGENLAGFKSYNIHELDAYLRNVGVQPYITKEGKFVSAYRYAPDKDGIEALGATDENFELLQLIPALFPV